MLALLFATNGTVWLIASSTTDSSDVSDNVEPVVATSSVERRLLEETLTIRCRVEATNVYSVGAAGSTSDVSPITRSLVSVGDIVRAGDVVAQRRDRPLIAVEGSQPPVTDLVAETRGESVTLVQEMLVERGHLDSGAVTGIYDEPTSVAVRALYEAAGYSPSVDPAAVAAFGSAELDYEIAKLDLKQAPWGAPRTRAELFVQAAERRLEDARIQQWPGVPVAEVWFVPRLPAEVVEVPTTNPQDSTTRGRLSVSEDPGLRARCGVSEGQADILTAGLTAIIGVNDVEVAALSGEVISEVSSPFGGQVAGLGESITRHQHYQPTSDKIDGQVGDTAIVIVTLSSTDREVLAVPAAAFDGGGQAVTAMVDGEWMAVSVVPGLRAGGWVELIDPPATLTAGTQVRLGS